MKIVRLVIVSASLALSATVASAGTVAAAGPGSPCVAKDTQNLTPTTRAPAWYVPGVTSLCQPSSGGAPIVEPNTAYWVYFSAFSPSDAFRTVPYNADYSARDCEVSFRTCGQYIISYAWAFWYSCSGRGLSGYDVGRNIRYWADRARANGPNWRVYTWTEAGGYPYGCAFSVYALS
jgi:hypothetical protein